MVCAKYYFVRLFLFSNYIMEVIVSIINKLLKEKTTYGIFDGIKYETLRKISCVMVILFMLNPAIQLAALLFLDISLYTYMHEYNKKVLFFGIAIIIIFLKKLADEKKMMGIKEWLKSNIPVTTLFIFCILMIITTILNGAPRIAIYGSYYRGEGLRGYLSYLVYFLLAAFVLTSSQKKMALNLFAKSSFFVAIVIIIDYMFLGEKYEFATGYALIFSQYNHLGYYMLVSIMTFGMLFITKKKLVEKIPSLIGFMVMLYALLMNDTWGCQMALFVGVIFIIIVYSIAKGKFQTITLVLVGATVFTYIFGYLSDERLKKNIDNNIVQQIYDTRALIDRDEIDEQTTGVSRIILWDNAFKFLCEKPIIGHGADVTGERLIELTHDNDRCHCEFLNYAVSFGVPTALVYVIAVFLVYLRGLKFKKKLNDVHLLGLCTAFAYLASSLIGNSMFYTAPYLFIMLGLGYVKAHEDDLGN